MLEQTFFPSFYEQTILFTQLTEQSLYLPLFAEQPFLANTIPPHPLRYLTIIYLNLDFLHFLYLF